MQRIKFACLGTAFASGLSTSAMAASPFPQGYDAAYAAFIGALPSGAKKSAWLTQLNGVTSEPKAMSIGGKPTVYLFACKNHSCDTDNVNIFLGTDKNSFRAVLKMGGVQTLLGGAAAEEVACVRKLGAAGGALDAC